MGLRGRLVELERARVNTGFIHANFVNYERRQQLAAAGLEVEPGPASEALQVGLLFGLLERAGLASVGHENGRI